MDPLLAPFLIVAVMILGSTTMAAYVDHRARSKIRAGELPPTMPWLILWWGGGIDPFYLFSPAFSRLQDGSTAWLIWPLRICVGILLALWGAAISAIGIAVWLNPAGAA